MCQAATFAGDIRRFGVAEGGEVAGDLPRRSEESTTRWARPAIPLGRIVRAAVDAIVGREALLVTLMASTAALGTVSVWQATRASDKANDLGDKARVAEAQALRQSSYAQTLVDHDVRTLGGYCSAYLEWHGALVDILGSGPDDRPVAGVVAGDLTMRALRPLLQADSPAEDRPWELCSGLEPSGDPNARPYLVVHAWGRAAAGLAGNRGFAGASDDGVSGSGRGRSEQILYAAGVAFAVSLFGLISIDVLGDRRKRPTRWRERCYRRWQRGSAVLAVVCLACGVVALVIEVDWLGLLLAAGVVVGLATWQCLIAHRQGTRDASAAPRPSSDRRGRPQWWAELIGGLTIVAFAAALVGLAYVTVRERDERGRSDRERDAAHALSQTGEQAALRDLASVAQLAALSAQVAAHNQENEWEQAEAIAARREATAEYLQVTESSIRDQQAILLGSWHENDCPTGPSEAPREPRDLLDESADRPTVFVEHLFEQGEPATACDVLSATTRSAASRWAELGSRFTDALILLGLAGVLLALAADGDRSRVNARWLLYVGTGALILGVVTAACVPVLSLLRGTEPLGRGELVEFSTEVAAGYHRDCYEAVKSLDSAIERSEAYGPAFAERAYARFCKEAAISPDVAMTSEVDEEAVPDIIKDLTTALEHSPDDPSITADLGWAHILNGLHGGPEAESELREGAELSRAAIEALEMNPSQAGTSTLHIARFNLALAHAALGHRDTARAEYARAVTCLEPNQVRDDCPGGTLEDPVSQAELALWALADLELIDGDPGAVDTYRELIVGAFSEPGGDRWNGAQLDVFPQEVQVAGSPGSPPPPQAAVVWYHRPLDEDTWGVLWEPSLTTIHTGEHLDRPINAFQYLPPGEYRADLYTSGERVQVLYEHLPPSAKLIRKESRQLAVAAVVPKEWSGGDILEGVTWSYGPDEFSGVTITRRDGLDPGADAEPYLEEQLEDWLTNDLEIDVAATAHRAANPDSVDYFLGLEDVVVREYDGWIAGAALVPYGSVPECGSAVIMAAVGEPNEVLRYMVFDSLVLSVPQAKLPPIPNPFTSDAFALRVPEGWEAVARPPGSIGNDFAAMHCQTRTNVLVTTERLEGRTVDDEVDRTIATYESDPDFAEFTLLERQAIEVPGATHAIELRFTWLSANGPVLQRQVYASDGRNIVYVTFTVHRSLADDYAADANVLVKSLQLLGG